MTCRLGGKEAAPPKILEVGTSVQSIDHTNAQSFLCHLS